VRTKEGGGEEEEVVRGEKARQKKKKKEKGERKRRRRKNENNNRGRPTKMLWNGSSNVRSIGEPVSSPRIPAEGQLVIRVTLICPLGVRSFAGHLVAEEVPGIALLGGGDTVGIDVLQNALNQLLTGLVGRFLALIAMFCGRLLKTDVLLKGVHLPLANVSQQIFAALGQCLHQCISAKPVLSVGSERVFQEPPTHKHTDTHTPTHKHTHTHTQT
jgi:hypothetical protein